ncbi:TetR/AcrR family transcriptional regulator [Paracoccus sp. 1_MG-2023]|uniref:TetR/AcrR family transcriptional regulator n=1 Tax=unclassified Paracoccus (in: a-proteobacteria) TaxID=2688777 RepID=UPI001C08F433|nr:MULTISPECIES: TetR/AcrR family transcriptional regulator [unclassified Paracoccus (in: a-proteobacteria)]MBU2957630.1 TetR/AcrR family transcriptional regulator [Paracoccus sp. C2R09]MDO6667523.1 TetR/AcrR family transcriptional regulator [Paracoccus sp. 1_MG-2023]
MRLQPRVCRTRGRPPSAEATERIVEAATCLFLSKGYAATSMQDVARQFGGSKQTIYARFPDKKALAEAVVATFTERKLHVPRQLGPGRGPAHETLNTLALATLESALDREAIMLLRLVISENEQVPELADIVQRRLKLAGLEMITDVMRRLVAEGQLEGPPDTLAQQFCDLVMMQHVWDALIASSPAAVTPDVIARVQGSVAFFLRAAEPRRR